MLAHKGRAKRHDLRRVANGLALRRPRRARRGRGHSRERGSGSPLGAYDDAMSVLAKYAACGLPPAAVLVHCFTGGAAELSPLVAAGYAIGLTGFVGMRKRAAPTVAALRAGARLPSREWRAARGVCG